MTDGCRLRVRYVLICDDLRTEDNGKQILIGVYTGGILFSKFPAQHVITVWCDVEQPEAGKIPLQLKVSFGKKDLFVAQVDMEVHTPAPTAVFAFKIPVRVESVGTLRFQMRQHADDWQDLKEIEVLQGPTAASVVQQPA